MRAPLALCLLAVAGCPGRETEAKKADAPARKHPAAILDVGTNAVRRPAAATNATPAPEAKKAAKAKKPLKLSPLLLEKILEQAVDTGNRKAIADLASKYRANPDPKARMEFLEALLPLNEDGVIYIVGFANDPDKEVSERAIDMAETQIDMVSDDFLKASLLGQVIRNLRDEDQLAVFGAKLESLPVNFAVKKIAEICQNEKNNPAAAAMAKRAYEAITGKKFISAKDVSRRARMEGW